MSRGCNRIRITQQGKAWRLRGSGVDLVVADLAYVAVSALEPCYPRDRVRE